MCVVILNGESERTSYVFNDLFKSVRLESVSRLRVGQDQLGVSRPKSCLWSCLLVLMWLKREKVQRETAFKEYFNIKICNMLWMKNYENQLQLRRNYSWFPQSSSCLKNFFTYICWVEAVAANVAKSRDQTWPTLILTNIGLNSVPLFIWT